MPTFFARINAASMGMSKELGGVQGISKMLVCVPLTGGWCGALQEGSERGELSETPYRLLNFGLAGAGLGHVLVFLPFLTGEGGGALTGIIAATWAVAAGIGGANFLGLLSDDE